MKRFPVPFVNIILCFVVFDFSGNKFHICAKKLIPKVIDPCNVPIVSSGSQLLLSNSLLLRFNEFILEICKVGHLKKKRLSRGK